MASWKHVARIDEIPDGDAIAVQFGKLSVAVFNDDGTFYAVNNLCPHAGGRLCEGFIEKGRVTCPWHGWSFPLSLVDPPNDGLPRYPLRVVDGRIEVDVPD